jgi:large subunit ribosomal protein L31
LLATVRQNSSPFIGLSTDVRLHLHTLMSKLAGLSRASSTELIMKSGIHPKYREVVFQDLSSDFSFLTRSTIDTKETIKWEDGKEYPLVKVEVSSASHPFYTGKHKVLDSGGRVDKFKKRYSK